MSSIAECNEVLDKIVARIQDKTNETGSPAMVNVVAAAGVIEALQSLEALLETLVKPVEPTHMEMIEDFHEKFRLTYKGKPRRLTQGLYEFRKDFMQEELDEYKAAHRLKDMEGMLDALVDLVYVALGTAYMHGFDFNEGFKRVQEANMKKVRVENVSDSKRKSAFDVVKPEGWTPPDLSDLV